MPAKKVFILILITITIVVFYVYHSDDTKKIKPRNIQNGFFEYNTNLAKEWYEKKGYPFPNYNKPPKSTLIIKTLEDWHKFRSDYLPGAPLIPMVDLANANFFNKYDLLYVNRFNNNNDASHITHAIEIKNLKLNNNKLKVEIGILQVAISNPQGIYFGGYSLAAIDKGVVPSNIDIDVSTIEQSNENKEVNQVENIYTGFTDNWDLYKQQVKIINSKTEWQAMKDKYLYDMSLKPIDFDQYSIVVLETFNGAKPTLSSAFKIKGVFVNNSILNIEYTDEPVTNNNELFVGIAIVKVKKSLINDYSNIKIYFK